MKTQIEQEPVACIYNGNQYMRHEFMDDKIPEGAMPLYAAPVDATRLEAEYQAATLRIDNDLMVIAELTKERDALAHKLVIECARKTILEQERDAYAQCADAYANDADTMAAAHKVERDKHCNCEFEGDENTVQCTLHNAWAETLQEQAGFRRERDALKDAARLALDALSEYGNPYNWDEDFHGIRRKWQEPKSNTPSAYNGFELAQPAIAALKAVL